MAICNTCNDRQCIATGPDSDRPCVDCPTCDSCRKPLNEDVKRYDFAWLYTLGEFYGERFCSMECLTRYIIAFNPYSAPLHRAEESAGLCAELMAVATQYVGARDVDWYEPLVRTNAECATHFADALSAVLARDAA